MNNAELKRALLSGEPVQRLGTRYSCVSAIIYRAYRGEIHITAELRDRCDHSVTIVHASEVETIQQPTYKKENQNEVNTDC